MPANRTAGTAGVVFPDAVNAAEASCVAAKPSRLGVDLERVGDVGEEVVSGGDVDHIVILPLVGLYNGGREEDAWGAALEGS